jgi:hypothetical protein
MPKPAEGKPPIVRGDSELGRFTAQLGHPDISALLAEMATLLQPGASAVLLADIDFDTADDVRAI